MILPTGLGLGWRAETSAVCAARNDLVAFEIIAETVRPGHPVPPAWLQLIASGRPVIPHGVALGLGDPSPLDPHRIAHLADLAVQLDAPCVSEHLAWVRAAGRETEHLLPIRATRPALQRLADRVRATQDALPCPLVLETIAHLFRWPGHDLRPETDLLAELVATTGVGLLIDIANLHANVVNGFTPTDRPPPPEDADHTPWLVATTRAWIDRLPTDSITYLHLAGGHVCDGFRHDTHAHPVSAATTAMAHAVLDHIGPRLVMLERDDAFGTRASFDDELDTLVTAFPPGPAHRWTPSSPIPSAPPRMPSTADSDTMSAHESHLIQAIFEGAPTPDGFDAATLGRLQHKLQAKAAWVASRRARANASPPPRDHGFWSRFRRKT